MPKSIADLQKLVLCAQTGTTGADYIKSKIRPTKTRAASPSTTTIMYQQVQSGRCDAAVYDAPILGGQKATKPSAYGPIVGQIKTRRAVRHRLREGQQAAARRSTPSSRTWSEDGTDLEARQEVPDDRRLQAPDLQVSTGRRWNDCSQEFFSPSNFRESLPDVWSGFQLNIRIMIIAEILVLILALLVAVIRGLPGPAAAPLRALAVVYTDFFRGTPLVIVALLISVGVPTLGYPLPGHPRARPRVLDAHDRAALAGDVRVLRHLGADDRVHGVRHRGLPRRHRVGPREPAHGGALARPQLRPVDALRGRAAGRPPRDPAAAERLHRAAEGHRDPRDHRRRRGDAAGPAVLDRRTSTSRGTWSPPSSSCCSRSRSPASPTT